LPDCLEKSSKLLGLYWHYTYLNWKKCQCYSWLHNLPILNIFQGKWGNSKKWFNSKINQLNQVKVAFAIFKLSVCFTIYSGILARKNFQDSFFSIESVINSCFFSVKILIQNGGDIYATNNEGKTPIHSCFDHFSSTNFFFLCQYASKRYVYVWNIPAYKLGRISFFDPCFWARTNTNKYSYLFLKPNTSSDLKKLVHNKKLYRQLLQSGKWHVPNNILRCIRYLWFEK